jgi:uncharacterized protein with PQ loop repeat
MPLSQLFGFLGTGIVAAAYIPQIHHLIKEHCSAGISMTAYGLWCIASILFLIHAVMIQDTVFIIVQIVNLAAILTIAICVKRYERQMCLTHLHEASDKRRQFITDNSR